MALKDIKQRNLKRQNQLETQSASQRYSQIEGKWKRETSTIKQSHRKKLPYIFKASKHIDVKKTKNLKNLKKHIDG